MLWLLQLCSAGILHVVKYACVKFFMMRMSNIFKCYSFWRYRRKNGWCVCLYEMALESWKEISAKFEVGLVQNRVKWNRCIALILWDFDTHGFFLIFYFLKEKIEQKYVFIHTDMLSFARFVSWIELNWSEIMVRYNALC